MMKSYWNINEFLFNLKENERTDEKKSGGKKVRKVKTVDLPVEANVPQLNKELVNLLTEKEVSGYIYIFTL